MFSLPPYHMFTSYPLIPLTEHHQFPTAMLCECTVMFEIWCSMPSDCSVCMYYLLNVVTKQINSLMYNVQNLDVTTTGQTMKTGFANVCFSINKQIKKKKSSVAPIAQPYYGARGHLSIHDGLITYDDRLIIPHCLRADVLQKIHEGHQSITKCRERTHQSVWWPKIGEEIVQQCAHCQKYKPTTAKEPMVPTVLPDRPWQMLGVDLLDFSGQQYMVVVDYYSRYIELVYLADTITHTVTAKLKCIFARFGIPDLLVSDKGPQFSSKEFRQFAD